jgi:hypothetical protein
MDEFILPVEMFREFLVSGTAFGLNLLDQVGLDFLLDLSCHLEQRLALADRVNPDGELHRQLQVITFCCYEYQNVPCRVKGNREK